MIRRPPRSTQSRSSAASDVEESKRLYPLGMDAAQVLGLVDVENDGQAGLELYYEDILGGKPGEILLEKDATGNPIPGSEKRRIPAVEGVDLELTMDKDIQICMENALSSAVERNGAQAGTALLMDCNTGDLSLIHISEPTRLGMISYA